MESTTSMRAWPRVFRTIASGLLLLQVAACFEYVAPPNAAIPTGSDVSLSINDQGRVALAEPIGPGLRRVNGQLLSVSDSTYVLAATAFEFIDIGLPVRANGKRVNVTRSFVTDLRVRRLNKKKSWVAAGLFAVGTALASTIAIVGFGGAAASDKPGGDGSSGQ